MDVHRNSEENLMAQSPRHISRKTPGKIRLRINTRVRNPKPTLFNARNHDRQGYQEEYDATKTKQVKQSERIEVVLKINEILPN